MPVTDDEAKLEVEEKLRKRQLTKPMTEVELAAFCNAMLRNLESDVQERVRRSSLVGRTGKQSGSGRICLDDACA